MDCPVCHNPMIVLELEMVEIDNCTSCGGIWLDSGELEQLFGDANKANLLIDSFNPARDVKENIHSCPICLKKMEKIKTADSGNAVIIDKCPKHHGLWFDKNELHHLLTANSLDKEHKIVKLLSEVFSKDNEVK